MSTTSTRFHQSVSIARLIDQDKVEYIELDAVHYDKIIAQLNTAERLLELVESAPDEWFAEYRAYLKGSSVPCAPGKVD